MGAPQANPQLQWRAALATIVAGAVAVLAIVWFVATIHRVILWLLIAGVLAMALDHVVAPMSRAIPRMAASVVAFLAGVAVTLGAAYLVVALIVDQFTQLIRALPGIIETLSKGEGPFGFLERELQVVERAQDLADQVSAGRLGNVSGGLIAVASDAVTFLLAIVSIAFLTLFMVIYGPRVKTAAVAQLPVDRRELAERISAATRRAAGGWVIGAAIVAVPATISAFIVLAVLQAPYPVALATVVMVTNPVPFVGATLASLVVGLVLLAENGLADALVFVIFMIAYNNLVENHVLVPFVYSNTVRLTPLGVLVALLVGAQIAGVPGALLGIPVAGAVKAAALETLRWRRARAQAAAVERITDPRAGDARAETAAGLRLPADGSSALGGEKRRVAG